MRKTLLDTGRIEPANVNMLNAAHASYAPVQCKTAILYVSGSRQVTEFRVDDTGFRVLVWVKSQDGKTVKLTHYRSPSLSSNDCWKTLEVDCLSGHARLSDRAPVRGVGGIPENRASARATDDVCTVVNWIRRAERWLDKRLSGQRKAILKANDALTDNADNSPDSRIPYLPPSMELELSSEAASNHDVYANTMPQHLNVGSVKHWDNDGALAMRGKRVSAGSSARALAGKRDRIEVLRAMAARQLKKATDYEKAGKAWEADIYAEMAAESDARAQAIQDELCARMAVARAARRTKRAGIALVVASPLVLEAVKDELTGVVAARALACKAADADEASA